MGKYAMAYYAAVNLANDMKHVHTHCTGKLFDTIHEVCNGYYEKANDNADTLAELAIENNEAIVNPAYAAENANYKPTNYKEYGFLNAMQVSRRCIEKYLEVLADLRNKTNDPSVQSLLDDIARYWKKEKDYKIKARLADLE